MMRQYELLERVNRYNPNADEGLLNKAYVYAMQKHGAQRRANGDPFFSHPLEVAGILTDLRLDDATIAAALLHDTIEDTDATRSEIDDLFGEDIGELVEGLTKIGKLDLVSRKAEQAENLRKLLLAVSRDLRVLLIKLADRLHNMRTLEFMPEDRRRIIAEETLDIYAPLAGRIGMQDMRSELEDIAFSVVNPEAHATITNHLVELRGRNRERIAEIETDLRAKLAEHGIKARVLGREKKAYSIFRKMERKAVSFEQLSDIYGFRVIVGSEAECYAALGLVHTTWPAVPGRFKDYLSTPKQNHYRSIHTTIVGPGRQRVELQIRTEEMDRVAEYGIAAHALYTDDLFSAGADGAGGQPQVNGHRVQDVHAYEWLRRTIESLSDGNTPEEFLEHTKLELFQDQVFCFTPLGRLIALPRGAIPIDFAYAVHTDIGDTCVGCKINGQPMALMTELQNGDEVEILCSETQVPPAAWESLVVTGKARAAIRRASRSAIRRQYTDLGRRILVSAFKRADKTYADESMAEALPRLAQQNVEDALAAVGRGEIPAANVVKAVYPDVETLPQPASKPPSEEGWFGLKRAGSLKFKVPGLVRRRTTNGRSHNDGASIPIRGFDGDVTVNFAPNGGALPGDRIVGILTPGEGITIYPIHSPELRQFEDRPELWLDVRWDVDAGNRSRFPVRIAVTTINEPGSLAQIAQVIAGADGNIQNIRIVSSQPDFSELLIDLEMWDLKHLTTLLRELRDLSVVSLANRVNG